jgi:hypothetical protein
MHAANLFPLSTCILCIRHGTNTEKWAQPLILPQAEEICSFFAGMGGGFDGLAHPTYILNPLTVLSLCIAIYPGGHRVRRFGTWAHWSSLFESLKNSNFKALKNFKKNMWT